MKFENVMNRIVVTIEQSPGYHKTLVPETELERNSELGIIIQQTGLVTYFIASLVNVNPD